MASGLRFANLGVLSFFLVVGLTAGFHELAGFGEESAYLSALVIAFCTNFLGARYYVYQATHAPIGGQLLRFLGSSIGFRAAEFVSFVLLHSVVGIQYLLVVGAIMIVSFVLKYLFFRNYVFS